MTIITSFLFVFSLIAQTTPPARTWFQNKSGQNTTIKERWAEDGQGLKHGTYIKYFSDGEREILGYYNHDKPNGQWEFTVYSTLYFQQVKSITYVNFLNGLQNGLYKTMMGDIVLVQGNYTNDLKTGYWKDDYNITDKIYSEGNYVNGKMDGEWKNTYTTIRSEDLMKAIQFERFENNSSNKFTPVEAVKTETRKGYRTIFKNGEVISIFDDKGVDLFAVQKQKETYEQTKSEFSKCSSIRDFENFRVKYPNSSFDADAIIAINEIKESDKALALSKKKEDDYLNPLIAQWKLLPDSSITFSYFNEYYKQFPNGYRKQEVVQMLENDKKKIVAYMDAVDLKYENGNKDLLIIPDKTIGEQSQYNKIYLDKTTDNIGAYDELFKRYPKVYFQSLDESLRQKVEKKRIQYRFQIDYLVSLNTSQSLSLALSMLNVINRYSGSLHNSASLPFSIRRTLLQWRFGDFESVYKDVNLHKNDVIEFSDGAVNYSKQFKILYKDYKIAYPNEKETWDKIAKILNL